MNSFNQLETKENKTMTKVTTIFLAPLVVVFLAGSGHAQLFIEDFDTYSAWAEGPGTQLTSKSPGTNTNGWMKGVIGNVRRQHGLINTDGINETQAGGGHSIAGAGDVSGSAFRDLRGTGEVNANGNYMVRALINPGEQGRGTTMLKIGDAATTLVPYANANELWVGFENFETESHPITGNDAHRDRIDLYTTRDGVLLYNDFQGGDPGECALNPNWQEGDWLGDYYLLPETGDAPCRMNVRADVFDAGSTAGVHAHFDWTPYGAWLEALVNVNMNNEVGTLWLRDVDDTTGEPTEQWGKFPWEFGLGVGSTVGIPFTAVEASGWQVVPVPGRNTVANLVDNFISGHPLLATQGDFDGDGDIDGNDFLIWQNNFPTTDGTAISFSGDATGDGKVDGDDFLIWQNSFPYPAALAKTPEPASLGLVALGGLLMLRRRAI